jgi:hypothetical protein
LPNIERLVNDCIGKASETKSIDIQRLLDPEVIWYATDIIFIFSLIGWVSELFLAGHPYIGHRFSAIHVWVSVLPSCSSERIKYMFPGGYLSFWDQLVSESNYNSGDVAVMHWVYVHSRREQPILHVSFLASKKDIEEIGKSGGVVIPVDFLNKEERDRLGLP